jgi:hypothetical protein
MFIEHLMYARQCTELCMYSSCSHGADVLTGEMDKLKTNGNQGFKFNMRLALCWVLERPLGGGVVSAKI